MVVNWATVKAARWVDVTVEMSVGSRVLRMVVQMAESWVGRMVERRVDSWVCWKVDKSAEC